MNQHDEHTAGLGAKMAAATDRATCVGQAADGANVSRARLTEAAYGSDPGPRIHAQVSVRATLSFSRALESLKAGARITRYGWNGRGMYLELQRPTKDSRMTRPYIFMKTVDHDLVPWVASQSDLLANDWAVLPAEE